MNRLNKLACRLSWFLTACVFVACVAKPRSFCIALDSIDHAAQASPGHSRQTIWYDPANQRLIPVELEDRSADTVHRNSRWLPKPKQASTSSPTPTTNWFQSSVNTGHVVAWTVIGIVLVVIVGFVFYLFSRFNPGSERPIRQNANAERSRRTKSFTQRMEELPAEVSRSHRNLKQEAERLMKAKQFDEAVICLFGHQLLLLDQFGILRLSKEKTNGVYLREARLQKPEIHRLFEPTVSMFEASYFGRHTPVDRDFAQRWSDNATLESMLFQTQAVRP